jgi:hypothetical protein
MEWKQRLKRMHHESIKSKSPGFFEASGGYSMKIKPYNDTTSNGLTKCIIDWINYSGGHAIRVNTQGQVRKERVQLAFGNYRDNITFTPSTTPKGTSDIKATMQGKSLNIEVKIGPDKMSPAQLKQKHLEEAAGALCFTAKNMESFIVWFDEICGVIKIESHAIA